MRKKRPRGVGMCALALLLGLCACGGSPSPATATPGAGGAASPTATASPASVAADPSGTPGRSSPAVPGGAGTVAAGAPASPAPPPISPAVSPVPFVAKGALDGHLERVDCTYIEGWAYDKGQPDVPLQVTILDGATGVATVRADLLRADLLVAGIGDGKHALRLPVPVTLKDNKPHAISARIVGSDFTLIGSPKTVTCGS
jgi:hypothetical protein